MKDNFSVDHYILSLGTAATARGFWGDWTRSFLTIWCLGLTYLGSYFFLNCGRSILAGLGNLGGGAGK